MKRFIFLSILLAASLASHAQGFEWVQTYTGPEITSGVTTNHLVGSCVDSAGNIYILGEFSPQAQLCGERLLPFDIITTPIQKAVVIAKLSPSGDLLWHKAIYNGKVSCYAYALRMVGDSSIMAMVHFDTPYYWSHQESHDLYYLDTLLTGNSDYLMPRDSVGARQNGFITFDFDGNVTEQHFVCVGFTDSIGNVLTPRFTWGTDLDQMSTNFLSGESFNIDNEGNIYVIRSVHADYIIGPYDPNADEYNMWRVDDGTIGALRIAVDGTHFLKYEIPHPTALWNQQILKFSPHFDSLLGAVYMFDSTTNLQCGTIRVKSFNVDAQNNIYLAMSGLEVPNHIGIANSNLLHLGDSFLNTSWMIKYNSALFAENVAQLTFDGNNLDQADPALGFGRMCVDDSNNTIFLICGVEWSFHDQINSILYNDSNLHVGNRSNFWLRLNKDDLSLLSVGRLLPDTVSSRNWLDVLSANNNRVLAMVNIGGAVFGDTVLHPTHYSFGIFGWDYNGHEIMVKTHDSEAIKNQGTQIHIRDSILYLTGVIYEDFNWDTIETHNTGPSQAFIAKYVDPEFARSYVHPSDRQGQTIEWDQELSFTLSDSPVILTATSTSGLPIAYTCNDSSIAYSDGSTLYLLRNGSTSVTASQQGDYYFLPAEPVTKNLLVNDVGMDALANSSPHIFPNPVSDVLFVIPNGEPITSIRLLSSLGRQERVTLSNNRIDLSHFPAGIYFLSIITTSDYFQFKIIKK